jgi:hypothetical protein
MMPLIDRWRPGALLDGDVRIVDIEATPRRGSLRIPLFMGNFIKEARECSVCTMTLGAVGTGDPEYWAHAIRGCRGDWTWKVSDFPTSEVLPECRHEFDICRECIATYIDVQLKSRGRNAVDHIACPSSDCSHEFTYAEMRRLATPESFSKYDHLATIDALSAMPSFRWCLSPDCSSGGFYAPPSTCEKSSSLRSIHPIMCSDCGFEMCFECDSPWHELLTCEQYQSQSSAEWIRTHTKRCPGEGCGVPLEKDNGCFQMSCAQCRHEFCWECLAAWDTIFVDELYIREGHAEGCYFRREGAWWPTMLTGADLEEALEGRDHIMYLDQEDSDDGEDYYYDYDYVD